MTDVVIARIVVGEMVVAHRANLCVVNHTVFKNIKWLPRDAVVCAWIVLLEARTNQIVGVQNHLYAVRKVFVYKIKDIVGVRISHHGISRKLRAYEIVGRYATIDSLGTLFVDLYDGNLRAGSV